jgi:hypothetical protein
MLREQVQIGLGRSCHSVFDYNRMPNRMVAQG